jgi:CheY-like chemotaxis protein
VRLLGRVFTASSPTPLILEASSAPEGLEIARSQCPDLVLLDLLMPGMTGYDFLRELRADVRTEDVPTIIMSARDLSDEASPVGVDIQLACPDGFSLTQLILALQAMLAVVTAPALVAKDKVLEPKASRLAAPVS